MADINLLNNQLNDTTNDATNRTKIVAWVLFLVFLAGAGFGVFIYLRNKSLQTDLAAISAENQALAQQVSDSQNGLKEAQAFQAQLSNINVLLKKHIALAPLFTELEKYTYLKAKYLTFDVNEETGKVHVEGAVDTYQGLAVLMLGLSSSEQFSNVKLLSVSGNQDPGAGYKFALEFNVASEIFKIKK